MQIIFNGKTYNSFEEMPANERQAYEGMFQIFKDENGNGIPDFLEGDVAKNVMTAFTGNVNFNGQVYTNLDELPPDARQKVQAAFAKLNQFGIVTGLPAAQAGTKPLPFEPAFQPSKPLLQQDATIEEVGGNRWILIVAFLGGLLVCAVAFALIMYLK